MKALFADSFYYLALANRRDSAHRRALRQAESLAAPIVTTAWVLTEVANSMSRARDRAGFSTLLQLIRADAEVTIIPASQDLFERGINLYRRPDKDWSLSDCISFVVMKERRLTEALTGDHHFEQAGFRALLKE